MPSNATKQNSKTRYSNHKTTTNHTNSNIIDDEKCETTALELQNIQYHSTQKTSSSSTSMLLYRTLQHNKIATKSKSTSSLKPHKHKKKHKKKKKHKHKSSKHTTNYCLFISFLISFIFLSIECTLIFTYILDQKSSNRAPFLSYNTYNDGEDIFNDINPDILYNFNYAEIYKFRDEMLSKTNKKNEINEYNIVYKQNLVEIGDCEMNENDIIDIDIHSNIYFNAYKHNQKLLNINDEVDGYILQAKNDFFLSFYLNIYAEYPLLYLILKNIFAFILIFTSILAPDVCNKLLIFIFNFYSILNSFFAFKNANIYLSFTKTAIPIYKRIIYNFYAPNNTKILLLVAFMQHWIVSGLYLYKKIKGKKRRKNKHISVNGFFYSLALIFVLINFVVLIPTGVHWTGFGVLMISSSSFSFSLGAILLLLDHCGLLEKNKRKKNEKKLKKYGGDNDGIEGNNAMIIFAKFAKKNINGKNINESGSVHRRRIKLMDGTVIKCQCDECKLRRDKRRKERK